MIFGKVKLGFKYVTILAGYNLNKQPMKTTTTVTIALFFVIVFCLNNAEAKKPSQEDLDNYSFEDYEQDFRKEYPNSQSRGQHMKAFQQRVKELKKLNSDFEGTTKFGLNELTDMTEEEHKVVFSLGDHVDELLAGIDEEEIGGARLLQSSVFPEKLDYRELGLVSTPKRQGQCGSCWDFAASGVIESLLLRDKGYEVDVSEQVGLKCAQYSCNGGLAFAVFEKFMNNGVPLESEFPYEPQTIINDTCSPNKWQTTQTLTTNTSALKLTKNLGRRRTNDELKYILQNYGTLATTVRAGGTAFTGYKSGILVCDPSVTSLDHEIQLVGWNDNDGEDGAWIIKNSWGPGWGEAGFARITMNESENCNLGQYAEYIFADFPNPLPTPVHYTLELTQIEGTGWNTNRIAIDQEGLASQIFGRQFSTGYIYTQEIGVLPNKPATVSIAIKGTMVMNMGLRILDSANNTICERKPGYPTPQGLVICQFCPGCGEVSTTPLTYQLLSGLVSSGNTLGYNGTKLGISFNGKMIEAGSDFISGNATQDTEFQWDIGSSIQIVSLTVPSYINTRLVGWSIKDQVGNILNSRVPSSSNPTFKVDKSIKIFLPTPSYPSQSGLLSSGSGSAEEYEEISTLSEKERTDFIIAIIILAVLLAIFIGISMFLFVRLKKFKKVRELPVSACSASEIRSVS